jgi:hypothetical protein
MAVLRFFFLMRRSRLRTEPRRIALQTTMADSLTILLELLARPSHVVTNPLTNPLTNSWASLLLKMTT